MFRLYVSSVDKIHHLSFVFPLFFVMTNIQRDRLLEENQSLRDKIEKLERSVKKREDEIARLRSHLKELTLRKSTSLADNECTIIFNVISDAALLLHDKNDFQSSFPLSFLWLSQRFRYPILPHRIHLFHSVLISVGILSLLSMLYFFF